MFSRKLPWAAILVVGLWAALGMAVSLRRFAPEDATLARWATGRLIVEQRSLPERDPFTFASTDRWVNAGWLGDALAYLELRAGGLALAELMGLELAFATAVLVLVRARSCARAPVSSIVAALTLVTLTGHSLAGPSAWGPFLLALSLVFLDRIERRGSVLALGATIGVAGHLHSFGALLLLVPGLELVASLVRVVVRAERAWIDRRALAALAIGAAGCALQPRGFSALAHPFACLLASSYRAAIVASSESQVPMGACSPWLLGIAAATFAGRPRVGFGDTLRVLVGASLALATTDFLPAFVVVASGPFAAALDNLLECARRETTRPLQALGAAPMALEGPLRGSARLSALGLALALGVALALRAVEHARGRDALSDMRRPEVTAAADFVASHTSGRVFNDWGTGGALAWAGRREILFDGRFDAAEPGIDLEILNVYRARPGFEKTLARRRCDVVLVGRWLYLDQALRLRGWRASFENARYAVLVRSDRGG